MQYGAVSHVKGTTMTAETLERLVPETILCHGAYVPVLRTIAHAPGQAPAGAPIRRDLWALELQTVRGSRWYGFERAPWIGADLRMHVILDNPRDTVRYNWEPPNGA